MGISNKCRWMTMAVVVLFFTIIACSFVKNEPWTIGDGFEYILQTASVQNHLTFGFEQSDLELAKQQFYKEADDLERTYHSMAIGNNGLLYSNHFGAYSALVTIVVILLNALNIYPIYAFRIVNLILWIVAVLVVFIALRADEKKKLGLILLLLFNPVFFYLTWIHTEMWLFAFCVIGLSFYYNKSYGLGIFFVSIAGMQNLGIVPLAMVMGVDYICSVFQNVDFKNVAGKDILMIIVKKIIPYGIFYIPAALPLITCYIHFGVLNRVAETARENDYLLSKAKDYLFDLNLGILPYEPIILLAFGVLLIYGMLKKSLSAYFNFLAVFGMIYIVANQLQINCGMEGIMRYNVWILPCMIFYVVMNINTEIKPIRFSFLIGAETIFTACMVIYTIWGSSEYHSYLSFAPWTKAIMDNYPELYNPSRGIFYSRAIGQEMYDNDKPICYVTSDAYLRKVCLSKEARKIFYSDDVVLIDETGGMVDKNSLVTVRIDKGDYEYLNTRENVFLAKKYALNDTIWFYTDLYNANDYVAFGKSFREDWGTWTDGDKLVMLAYIPEADSMVKMHIDVANTFYRPQNITVLVNGTSVYNAVIEGETEIEFKFESNEVYFYKIEILLPDSIRPTEVSESKDSRDLGIALRSVSFSWGK